MISLLKKYKFYILGIFILAEVGYFMFNSYKNTSVNTSAIVLKCPENYTSGEEHRTNFNNFKAMFYEKNPDADAVDLTEARRQYYIDNNCRLALERAKEFNTKNYERDSLVSDIILGILPRTYKTLGLDGFKCPDQYINTESYLADLDRFANQLRDNDPWITDIEIERIKHGWLVAYNCLETQ